MCLGWTQISPGMSMMFVLYVCMYECMYVSMYVCVFVCMYVYVQNVCKVCIYMYWQYLFIFFSASEQQIYAVCLTNRANEANGANTANGADGGNTQKHHEVLRIKVEFNKTTCLQWLNVLKYFSWVQYNRSHLSLSLKPILWIIYLLVWLFFNRTNNNNISNDWEHFI